MLHNTITKTNPLSQHLSELKSWMGENLATGKSFRVRLATDSEYESTPDQNNLYIGYSMQRWEMDHDNCGGGFWLEHPDFRSLRQLQPGEQYPHVDIAKATIVDTIIPEGVSFEFDPTMKCNKHDDRPIVELETVIYFAPGDLMCLFPAESRAAIACQLEQNGSVGNKDGNPIWLGVLRTDEHQYRVALRARDVAKEGPPGGLKKLADAAGAKMLSKGEMDEWKSCMTAPYLNPAMVGKFIDYAIGDTAVIPLIHKAHQKRYSALAKTVGLRRQNPTREYWSMGAMVSDLTIEKIHDVCRLPDGSYPWERFLRYDYNDIAKPPQPWELKDLLKFASVKYLAKKTETSKTLLAIVNGGLAKNMKPSQTSIRGIIADWDVSGAYAACQQKIDYCLGIPHTYGLHENSKQKPLTLGEFLKKHGDQLLPRKWVISVTGKLNHTQSLIPSKIVTEVQINNYSDNDDAHVPGDFCVLGSEIINGVITSDNLDIIREICTRSELKSWMDLTVGAAAWYPKSHQCHTPEEWDAAIASCENDVYEKTRRDGTTYTVDTRSKHWFSFPLNDILGPWIAGRDEYKRLMKAATTDEEKAHYNGLQTAMKLGNNCNYGVQASPLFPVGNVVTANNITALCRAVVWASVMAGNGSQVITDGFCYDVNKVRFPRKLDRIGMNTLCLEMLDGGLLPKDHRNCFEYGPLGGECWTSLTHEGCNGKGEEVVSYVRGGVRIEHPEESHTELDDLFTGHAIDFWKALTGKTLDCFDMLKSAHKHVYQAAYFHSQTNYSFVTAGGKSKVKARGHQLGKEHTDIEFGDLVEAPYKTFIKALADNPEQVPLPKPATVPSILKINAYNNRGANSKLEALGVMAGDSVSKQVFIRPISLSPFLFKDAAQREAWMSRNERLKARYGWGLEQFFLTPDGKGINYGKAMRDIHNAIARGDNWIRDKYNTDPKNIHPYMHLVA